MSQSIRFLGLAVMAWAGVRAVSLGLVPGTQALAFDLPQRAEAATIPPVQPTQLPPIQPVAPQAYQAPGYGPYAPYPPHPQMAGYMPYPVYVQVPAASRSSPPVRYADYASAEPRPANPYFEPVRPIDWVMPSRLQAARTAPAEYSLPWSVWKMTPATASRPPRTAIAVASAA